MMCACCVIAHQLKNLEELAQVTPGLSGHGLSGAAVSIDLGNVPISLDIHSLEEVDAVIQENVERELYLAYRRAAAAGDTIVICHTADTSPCFFTASNTMFGLWGPSASLRSHLAERPIFNNELRRTACQGPIGEEAMVGAADKISQVLAYISSDPMCGVGSEFLLIPKGARLANMRRCIGAATAFFSADFANHARVLISSSPRWYRLG